MTLDGQWKCAGCGAVVAYRAEVDQRIMDRHFNPAVYIAEQKRRRAQLVAENHVKLGCERPV
jgi:hypothetical protein